MKSNIKIDVTKKGSEFVAECKEFGVTGHSGTADKAIMACNDSLVRRLSCMSLDELNVLINPERLSGDPGQSRHAISSDLMLKKLDMKLDLVFLLLQRSVCVPIDFDELNQKD